MHAPVRSHPVGILLVALVTALPGVSVGCEPGAGPHVEWRGTLTLPGTFTGGDGKTRSLAETSGIAWVGGDRYVAAMDGDDHLLVLRVAVDDDGAPLEARAEGTIALGAVRDWEDVAVVGSGSGLRLFAVEEGTPAVREFLLDAAFSAARPVATRSLRVVLRGMRPNRGPESLAASPGGEWLWTANEETLEGDGPAVRDGVPARVRLVRIPVPGTVGRRPTEDPVVDRREWVYETDPPHDRVGLGLGPVFSGVVAIVALDERRLVVLERSAGIGLPPFESRIFLVDVTGQRGAAPAVDVATAAPLPKRLLWRGSLGVNLEGLCAGPGLDDGRRVLVGVADNAAGERKPDGTRGPSNPVVVFTLGDGDGAGEEEGGGSGG